MMDLGLKGKVALVTGAGSQKGFGKAIALALAREGCDVIVCDIDAKGADLTAAEIQKLGGRAMAAKMDITDSTEVKSVLEEALKQFKAIDILVNNAGAISPVSNFVDKSEAEWHRDIELNLIGTMNCTYAILPQMIARGSGKIVNISSIGATLGLPRTAGYGSAKAGVVGFTKNLGVEVAPSGININSVAPGIGLTNFGGGAPPPEMLAKAQARIPTRRINEPQDIANAVVFLASDAARNIVGQNLGVDGGEGIL
jgi:NAD(P)-dependent dehydrogenase (short-subunit alcohol dehydrogenase family)